MPRGGKRKRGKRRHTSRKSHPHKKKQVVRNKGYGWVVEWTIVHAISLYILAWLLGKLDIPNEFLFLLVTGFGVKTLSSFYKQFKHHKRFRLGGKFFYWGLINTLGVYLGWEILKAYTISSNITYYLIAGLILVIVNSLFRGMTVDKGGFRKLNRFMRHHPWLNAGLSVVASIILFRASFSNDLFGNNVSEFRIWVLIASVLLGIVGLVALRILYIKHVKRTFTWVNK